ncbi:MAG: thiamine pyrophosphate-binding protein [Acidimicrobiales bacterium]
MTASGAHDGDRSVADAYLELLAHRGVEYLFGNGGTDFGPIIDAYARRVQADEPVPQPVTVPHEIPAMAMAHGYAMVSGKIPAVMVHTIAGTANAIGGLINANRAQVPIFFSAGRTPLTEGGALGARDLHIHWAQGPSTRVRWCASGSSGTTSCVTAPTWCRWWTVPWPSPVPNRTVRST